jgi:hypothetical protein
MANNDGERRMLFDIRGRRKNVVKVVYAILALLMGLSLFILAGSGGIGSLFNSDNSSSEAAKQFEDQATTIERKLKKEPENADLLLALTRQRINAGNTLSVINPETGTPELTIEARQQYEQASNAWLEYLKATDEPSPSGAQLVSPMCFSLAETSSSVGEAEANIACAAEAQKLVATARPNLNSLSTLAIYSYFTFDYESADKAGEEAKKFTNSKFERENLENQLEETKKSAKATQKRFAEFEKANKGQGKQALQSPLGGLSGESTLSP